VADYLTVVHECKDFAPWKTVFDADAVNRKAAGLTDLVLRRESARPNMIALVFQVSDLSKAKAFVTSEPLRAAMQKAGIIGMPNIHFRRGEFTNAEATTYLTVNCKVSGIDTFKRGYAMDKADRVAAGLTDLGLLQDIEDPNDLLLAWSVADVPKVKTFLASPALAAHMTQNCGIVSEPLMRFWTK
jgi:hypothetical protein